MGTHNRFRLVTALALTLTLTFPAMARAFDLDGDWRGTVRCRERTPQLRTRRFAFPGLLRITQDGAAVGLSLHTASFIRAYAGMTVFDVRRPDIKGEVAFALCGTDDAPVNPTRAELGRFIVLADRDHNRGRLRGNSMYTVDGDTIGSCMWRFKWETTVDPGVALTCP